MSFFSSRKFVAIVATAVGMGLGMQQGKMSSKENYDEENKNLIAVKLDPAQRVLFNKGEMCDKALVDAFKHAVTSIRASHEPSAVVSITNNYHWQQDCKTQPKPPKR